MGPLGQRRPEKTSPACLRAIRAPASRPTLPALGSRASPGQEGQLHSQCSASRWGGQRRASASCPGGQEASGVRDSLLRKQPRQHDAAASPTGLVSPGAQQTHGSLSQGACCLFHGCFLRVSSHGGGARGLWGLSQKGTNSIREGPTLLTSSAQTLSY